MLKRAMNVVGEEWRLLRMEGRRLPIAPLIAIVPNQTLVRLRTTLYRLAGVEIGHGSVVLGAMRLWGPERLVIGSDTTINGPIVVCLDAPVEIGDGVLIGHDTVIATGAHAIGPATARGGAIIPRRVVIGDGVWIGARVTVLPGVSIGAGSVVAGGSVVVKDIPPNSLAMGVPARVTRELGDGPELPGDRPSPDS